MHSKIFISKIHFKITHSKNTFQNFYSKIYFKIAPSKNVFQNCYLSSNWQYQGMFVFFSQKNLKIKKNKFNF